jgi:putative sugar O-methyltransferase
VEADLDFYLGHRLIFEHPGSGHTRRWERKLERGRRRIIGPDNTLNRNGFKNFRRRMPFAGDNPKIDLNKRSLGNLLDGRKRGERALMVQCFAILESHGFLDFLRKYPSPEIGNPRLFEHANCRFTHRWFRHVYGLGQMNRFLRAELQAGSVLLDIGSAYGIFQGLVYQEFPGCHNILVDLPEQLLLARYFLSLYLPEARIGSVRDLPEKGTLPRDLIRNFDFLLLPPAYSRQIEQGSIDLVTSFACLGELKREVFEFYVKAPAIESAQWIFLISQIDPRQMGFNTDVTMLDYPIWTRTKVHFCVSPAYFHPYIPPRRIYLLLYEFFRFPPFFEYIGRLKEGSETNGRRG